MHFRLYRIKREVSSSMVDKGVHERMRLTQIYEKRKEELEKQHQEVRHQLEEEKNRVRVFRSKLASYYF